MAEDTPGTTRRDLLRKGLFVAPAILTLAAVPSSASAGSDSGSEDTHPWIKPTPPVDTHPWVPPARRPGNND
jgi:hypothetical protein